MPTIAEKSSGGLARARNLTPERRAEIASKAALTRWVGSGKEPPAIAKYGAPDRPLRIGTIEIPCYVLEDGRRVLSQRGLQVGIGLSTSGGEKGARRVVTLMGRLSKKGIDIKDLDSRGDSPIRFIPPHGQIAYGYEATILPDICNVIIEAGMRGKLASQQKHLAERCRILQHGFATVGIIALVDEATGYQKFRPRDELTVILEAFVAKELRPWIRTFPPEFYQQIYRLNNWEYNDSSNGKPQVIGHWTNNIVYKRLAPGVLAELRRLTPRDESGNLVHRLFQRLTDTTGQSRLRHHLDKVVLIMKYAPNWKVFMKRLDQEIPQFAEIPDVLSISVPNVKD